MIATSCIVVDIIEIDCITNR